MLTQLIKPLLAAVGSSLMLSLLLIIHPSDASQNHMISADDVNGKSLVITHVNEEQSTYIVDGQVYTWNDLTREQQTRLTNLKQQMKKAEKELKNLTQHLTPFESKLEIHAAELEAAAHRLSSEAANFEARSLPDLEAQHQAQEEALQKLEIAMVEQEKIMAQHEEQMRQMEEQLEKKLKPFEDKIYHYLEEVINVLENE